MAEVKTYSGKLLILSEKDIQFVQVRLKRDFFQEKPSVFAELFSGWMDKTRDFFTLPSDDFHKDKIVKMHNAYRLCVDNGEIPPFDGSAKNMTAIAKKIDPLQPQAWSGKIYMMLQAMASCVRDGQINGGLLYPEIAAAKRETKSEDSIIQLPDMSQFSTEAKKTAGVVTLAVVGIGGLYLYGLVTANRALSRWRNR